MDRRMDGWMDKCMNEGNRWQIEGLVSTGMNETVKCEWMERQTCQ